MAPKRPGSSVEYSQFGRSPALFAVRAAARPNWEYSTLDPDRHARGPKHRRGVFRRLHGSAGLLTSSSIRPNVSSLSPVGFAIRRLLGSSPEGDEETCGQAFRRGQETRAEQDPRRTNEAVRFSGVRRPSPNREQKPHVERTMLGQRRSDREKTRVKC